MPLIKCIDCGKMISDRIESCPQCGCPVSVSLEENNKLMEKAKEEAKIKAEEEKNRIEEEIKAPAVKFEVDVEAELDILYDLFAPAILNEREITKVGDQIMDHFKKFRSIGDGVVSSACCYLERAFQKHQEVIEYVDNMKNQKLKMALDQYTSEMNKPIEGLGFGIISTSAADTMLYGAMSARNAAKQYMKNTKTANENLHANLMALGANSDNLMSESNVIDFKYKIRKAVEVIKEFAEKKFFMDSHKEFIYHPEKYDNGKEIDGTKIYSILYRGEHTRLLYIGGYKSIIPGEILKKAENEGYIVQFPGNYYCTTLKYEKEVLEAIFKEENPEEYAKLQAEKQSNAEVVYNKALEDLEKGLYYEAATALGSISGYKDAIEISVKIWHEKLLCQDWFYDSLGSYFALKDDGTVLAGGRAKDEEREKTKKWQGVEKLYNMSGPGALTFDGKLLGTVTPMYSSYDGEYKLGLYNDWKKLKSITGRFVYVGVKNNGSVVAMGKNEEGLCDNCTGYTDIQKASCRTTENIALLTKDGKVKVVGGEYKGYEAWEDVVDIASDYTGLYGFKKDGTVYYLRRGNGGSLEKYRTYYGTHPDEWKDIYKYFGDCKAIDKYGKVYNYGYSEADKKLAGLKDIVHIENDSTFTACIKADGTLQIIDSKIDISKWENIISIWGSYDFAVGLKPDGTLVMDGDITNREELENWKLFEHINKRKNLKEEFIKNKRLADEKELADAKNELANLKGLFAGSKRKQLEAKIAELEQELSNA